MVVVENSFESSKGVMPFGLEFNQEQNVDFNKEFGEEEMKEEVANISNDNVKEGKLGNRFFFPKTYLLSEIFSLDDQFIIVKIPFILKIFSLLKFPELWDFVFQFFIPCFLGGFLHIVFYIWQL